MSEAESAGRPAPPEPVPPEPAPLQLAQSLEIQPTIELEPAPAPEEPGSDEAAGAGDQPSFPSISPTIDLTGSGATGSEAPSAPAPAAPAGGTAAPGGEGQISITIANPEALPPLAPGKNELTIKITSDQAAAPAPVPADGGIGFIGVFIALLAALILAPPLQKRLGGVWENVNAIGFIQKNGIVVSAYLLTFTLGWIVFMIVLPQVFMLDFSFRYNLSPSEVGGPNDVYTLKNYKYLLLGRPGDEELFNYLHLTVFARTIIAAFCVTVVDFALCYPIAYYMAQAAKGGNQRLLFLCLILPFWVNEILRAFAFTLIFAEQGLINHVMISLGLWSAPFEFIQTDVALYSGLTYAYILLMIFPLYNAIESLDHNQIEAARDLGSPWWRIHYRVVMPYAKPGIASGCTMVFMLTAGALAAPNILGGPSSLWFTQIIYQWFNTGGNWPQGSAYAFVLLVSCIIFVRIMMRVFNVGLGDIARR